MSFYLISESSDHTSYWMRPGLFGGGEWGPKDWAKAFTTRRAAVTVARKFGLLRRHDVRVITEVTQ